MPGLQDRPADPHSGPHCRGLRLLTGAPDRRHLMTTVSKPSTNSLTSPLPFLRAIRRSLSETVFWRSRNVGAVCRPRNCHPPKWRVTISTTEPSRRQAFSGLPSTRPSFNTHSSRSGSVQRILSAVPAPGLSRSADFIWGRAPPIECSSLSVASPPATAPPIYGATSDGALFREQFGRGTYDRDNPSTWRLSTCISGTIPTSSGCARTVSRRHRENRRLHSTRSLLSAPGQQPARKRTKPDRRHGHEQAISAD